LVFEHVHAPQAGIQVPGGTLHPGERPSEAVLRKAREETELTDPSLGPLLGVETCSPCPSVLHRGSYYHLVCRGCPPECWQHYQTDPSDGSADRMLFELYWVGLPDRIPPLSGGTDHMLPHLLNRLRADARAPAPADLCMAPPVVCETTYGRSGSRSPIHGP